MATKKKSAPRPKSTKATGRKRNYKREYARDHASPSQIANRAKRNKARADAVKAGRVKKGDGKVVDHKTPLRKGGSNKPSNTRVTTRKKNAGWRKGKSGYD